MYSYTKKILKKVSFDPALFRKELYKAQKYLHPQEYQKLTIWLNSYVKKHPTLQYCLIQ
jgi:hypothetical protein